MPRFTYVSRNGQGERITAIADSDTRQSLLSDLKGKGLTVVEIQELNAADSTGPKKSLLFRPMNLSLKRINTGDLAIFWRQLSTMIAAGLPIIDTVESIHQELEQAELKKVLTSVISQMWEGLSFSQSLQKHAKVFSPMVIALIAAAEESGSLAEVTNQIATFIENRDKIIHKVRAALTYPFFLCGFFLIVMAVSTFWIIPKFREIFSSFDTELPFITEFIFKINDLILHFFPVLIVLTAILIGAVIYGIRTPLGRNAFDRFSLNFPVLGKLIHLAGIARFCRSLGVLLSGGVPINRALQMVEETSGNTLIANSIRAAREEILKGSKIAAALRKQPLIPKMASRMIAAGEETGNMTLLLDKCSEFYESRVDASITTINTLIEPIMIILIGAFVLVFVLALYMPIFKIGMAVSG
jgi:type IV pilus assembly protein PilC